MLRYLSAGCLMVAAAIPLAGAAKAQTPGNLTLYSDVNLKGRSYTITGPRKFIQAPFAVRSIRISPGSSWLLCEEPTYGGTCNRVTTSIASVRWTVRSGRPERSAVTPPASQRSLRGTHAEFFPAPANAGGRIACAKGANGCATRANRFCQTQKWNRAAYHQQHPVRGRIYLSDVLCTGELN